MKKQLRFIYKKNSNELFRKTATLALLFFCFFRSSCTLFILWCFLAMEQKGGFHCPLSHKSRRWKIGGDGVGCIGAFFCLPGVLWNGKIVILVVLLFSVVCNSFLVPSSRNVFFYYFSLCRLYYTSCLPL